MLLYIALSVTGSLVYEKFYFHANMHTHTLNLLAPTRQNDQMHSKNLSALANESVECV